MRIEIPELSLTALVGISGSGKTTFAHKYFKNTEVLSSDYFRALLSDDENNQKITREAFDALFYIAGKRLNNGRLTVMDATHLKPEDRKKIINLAHEQNCMPIAIVIDTPLEECLKRNEERADRNLSPAVQNRQYRDFKRNIKHLKREGFRYIFTVSPEDLKDLEVVRTKMWTDKKELSGPFDIIGDVHGCYGELCELLTKLGYEVDKEDFSASSPDGRTVIFLGDLTDRGPENLNVLKLVMNMCSSGCALAVPGNHDVKLLKYLNGSKVADKHGFGKTAAEVDSLSDEEKKEVKEFLKSLISHYVLDNGKLVVAHAGVEEKMQGRGSGRVREFCLYGDVRSETDESGLPLRYDWTQDYRGTAFTVYGHIPHEEVKFSNNTACIDTGCVFGGKLTALRYPENEIVSVAAKETYCEPLTPLRKTSDFKSSIPDIKDILNTGVIYTPLAGQVKIYEENRAAALEVISRYSADPKWLIYLPPTMSPCEASTLDDYLEYPTQAFKYFADNNVKEVICEKKHMGSRCVIIVCRNKDAAEKRFGVKDGSIGIFYTRTGREMFTNLQTQRDLLERLKNILEERGFFDDFHTDWVCLDAEAMPWSAKAIHLIKTQYAPVGRSGRQSTAEAVSALKKAVNTIKQVGAADNSIDLDKLLDYYRQKEEAVNLYTDAYREYCFRAEKPEDYRIAPFHILAAGGEVFNKKDHLWHMENIKKYIAEEDGVFIATPYIIVNTEDDKSVKSACGRWLNLTGNGGEGMVVKPMGFTVFNNNKLVQPAIKCRGREYLRIIYGPEYIFPDHLRRLKKRSLNKKRRLALAEYALGILSLERFVKGTSFADMHEAVFGVLALESEPIDPRL